MADAEMSIPVTREMFALVKGGYIEGNDGTRSFSLARGLYVQMVVELDGIIAACDDPAQHLVWVELQIIAHSRAEMMQGGEEVFSELLGVEALRTHIRLGTIPPM